MPDTPAAGTPPTTATTSKYGDKFGDDTGKLEQGFRELASKKFGLKFEDGKPLVGDGAEYANHDELYRQYKGYERAQGARANKPVEQPADGTINLGTATEPDRDADYDPLDLVKTAGLELDDIEMSISESGDLTKEQFAAIRKLRPNIGKADAKLIARGLIAEKGLRAVRLKEVMSDLHEIAGGEEPFKTLVGTAKEYVDPSRLISLNKLINDPATAPMAMHELKRLYDKKHGSGVGDMVKPGGTSTGNNGGGTGFETFKDYSEAVERIAAGTASASDKARLMKTDANKLRNT